MKSIRLVIILVFGVLNAQIFFGQELYTESSAISITNESNGLGSITLQNESPSINVSSDSDVGFHSVLIENTNNDTYGRYRVNIPVTSGEQIRVRIKFKTENELGTGFGDGFVWIEHGITTNSWTSSTQTGWQIIDEVVTTNADIVGITFGVTQTTTANHKIWVDELSVISLSSNTDTTAPSSPTLSSSSNTDTTVDLSWNGATDDTGVTGYKVFRDGSLEATLGNVSTHQVPGLTAGTTYGFTVTALDAAGNESSISNAVSVTTESGSSGGGSSVWLETGSVASYTGDVAIGSVSVPTGYKLAVEGKIRTREVRVDQETWPDYVFEEDYDLPTLEEVQKHIIENGHLPNIPSAEEVEMKGIELGEMNRLLLEKIEEMMLYILKQELRIEQLEKNTIKP